MMKSFTKALSNTAADSIVHLFENDARLTDCAVCSFSFLTTAVGGDKESAQALERIQCSHDDERVTLHPGLRPSTTWFSGTLAWGDRLAQMLLQGVPFGDELQTSSESCAYASAIARLLDASVRPLGDCPLDSYPMDSSARSTFRVTFTGVGRGLYQFLALGAQLLGRTAKTFIFSIISVADITVFGINGLRDLHLGGDDTDIRSGRGELLQQYP